MDDGGVLLIVRRLSSIVCRLTHIFRRRQRAPSREHAQAGKQRLVGEVEQVVAPFDGGAQGLLAGGQVSRPTREQGQALAQAGDYFSGRQQLYASSRKLDS